MDKQRIKKAQQTAQEFSKVKDKAKAILKKIEECTTYPWVSFRGAPEPKQLKKSLDALIQKDEPEQANDSEHQ